jgi:hypothetical protein
MSKYKYHIILIITLSILLIVFDWLKPDPLNWQPTLINSDKSPYGSYILFNETNSLFPEQKVRVSRQPVYNQLGDKTEKLYTYVLIAPAVSLTHEEMQEIKSFVKSGNHVFIASENLPDSFCDSFGIESGTQFELLSNKDTVYHFCNPEIDKSNFAIPSISKGYFMVTDSTLLVTALMEDQQKRKVMLKIKMGEGSLILCSLPLMFSNWFILQNGMSSIPFKALSYLPADRPLVWDEYMKQGRDEDTSPIRAILANRALTWAYLLSLFGILLILVFETRRRRSIVPVVEPLKNTSVEFVKIVGLLHYEQRNYSDIAHKRITYFLERIRLHYHLATQKTDKDFAAALSEKSGYGPAETENMVAIVNRIRFTRYVTPEELIELNKSIESFVSKTKLKT